MFVPQILSIEIEAEVVGYGGPKPTAKVLGHISLYKFW